jgi:hypothetical protein
MVLAGFGVRVGERRGRLDAAPLAKARFGLRRAARAEPNHVGRQIAQACRRAQP